MNSSIDFLWDLFWPRKKSNQRHPIFRAVSLTLVPRSLLRNSTETLATQANTATERFHRDMKILMFSLSIVC